MNTSPPILRNIEAVAALESEAVKKRTWTARATDAVTKSAGSTMFVAAHAVICVVWIWLNRGAHAFDPYPFALLNLLLSLEAIVLTSFVLMTQERMTRQADRRAHLDLQVNLLAEQELTTILHMVHALCQRANIDVNVRDERVAALLKETDIRKLADALDSVLAPTEREPL
jgi:uncharacterized membrane protein